MVTLLAPVVTTGPTYVKVANMPGLYRHARSGRYYACKKLNGIRRERSLGILILILLVLLILRLLR